MTELDKFKRRLIRSVARRIMQEGQPEDDVWEDLQKQTGCDCKLLWQRMHALTIKKLKRLLAVSDRPDCVSAVARMSATDWLLYDLVLVLEKLDVIDAENIKVKGERPALKDLYDLVVAYDIENLSGSQLADAWEKLAAEYNSSGRRCSPILLQSRWYQMKELTRKTFYKLWFTYRGNQRNWDQAVGDVHPTDLQSCIAKRFPKVVTEPFDDFETLIRQKKIILKDDFDLKKFRQIAKPNDDKPDLEMIEPKIDTIAIDSDEDSNEGNAGLSSEPKAQHIDIKKEKLEDDVKEPQTQATKQVSPQEINLGLVKQEKTDDSYSIATNSVSNATGVDNIMNDSLKKIQMQKSITVTKTVPCRKNINEEKQILEKMPLSEIENFKKAIIDDIVVGNDNDDNVDSAPIKPTETDKIENLKKALIEDIVEENNSVSNVESAPAKLTKTKKIENLKEAIIKDIVLGSDRNDNLEKAPIKPTKTKKIENLKKAIIEGIIVENDTDNNVKNAPKEPTETEKDVLIEASTDPHEDLVKQKMNEYLRSVGQVHPIENEETENLKSDVNDIIKRKPEKILIKKQESNPYDTALPNGVSFDNGGMDIVDDGLEIVDDGILEECEDVNTNNNGENLDDMVETEIEIDIKLKLKPIVYTTKLDTMNVLKDKLCASVDKKELIDAIAVESKPINKLNIKVEKTEEENDTKEQTKMLDENFDDEDIPRVKPTSLMLQKPKHCTYNTVQVCKNPDFNTRLKRLTAGFFCSPRNRRLLSTCKPLTVDLTKAFESRLVDGTLYLKQSSNASNSSLANEKLVHATSVMPSAIPVQGLMTNQSASCHTDIKKAPSPPPFKLSADLLAARNNVIRDLEILNASPPTNCTVTHDTIPEKLATEIAPAKTSTGIADLQAALLKDIGKLDTCSNVDSKMPETDSLLRIRDTNPLKYTLTIDDKNVPDAEKNLLQEKVCPQGNSLVKRVGDLNDVNNQGRPRFGPNVGSRFGPGVGPRFRPNIVRPNLGPNTGPSFEPIFGPNVAPKRFMSKNSRITFNQLPGRKVDCSWTPKLPSTPEDGLLTMDTLSRMLHKLNGVEIPAKTSKKKEYCCWANEKIASTALGRDIFTPHRCVVTRCVCCCRVKLANVLKSTLCEVETTPAQQGNESASATIDQSQPASVSQSSTDIQPQDSHISETERIIAPVPVKKRVRRKRNANTQTGVNTIFDDDVSKKPKIRVYSGNPKGPAPALRSIAPGMHLIAPGMSPIAPRATQPRQFQRIPQIENLYHKIPQGQNQAQLQNQHQVQLEDQHQVQLQNQHQIQLQNQHQVQLQNQLQANLPNQIQEKPLLRVNVKLVSDTAVPEITMVPIEPTPVFDLTQTDLPPSQTLQQAVCPTPVIDPIKKRIIIDGTVPIRPKKKNFIFLRNDKPKDNPIFLGKNKVLLTTVEFPPYLMDGGSTSPVPLTEITAEETPSPPVVALPAGVQLVMMADGKLTYATDQNIVLTESEQATLKSVVDVVQSQIDATLAQAPSSDVSAVNNVLQTGFTPATDIASGNATNINFQLPHSGIDAVEETTLLSANTANQLVENNTDTVQTAEMPNAVGEKQQEKTSNSLLSDLMQMSGISSEDTALSNQQTSSPTSVTEVQASTVSSVFDIAQYPALHPITSVKQLKYACHHNGQFFKLDVITGIIVPINVSVKRNLSVSPSKPQSKQLTKAVIDLTDDGNKNSSSDDPNESIRPKILKSHREVPKLPRLAPRPVKLFKTAIKPKQSLLKQVNREELNSNTKQRKRKQCLEKIEAKIDLVDSDEPMEEEYLLNSDSDESTGSGEHSNVIINVDLNDDDDDSSDDEPLASKSVRMRNHNTTTVQAQSTEGVVNEQHNNINSNVNPRSVLKTAPEAALEADEEMPASPMEIEETPLAPYLQSYSESPDEDCILGV